MFQACCFCLQSLRILHLLYHSVFINILNVVILSPTFIAGVCVLQALELQLEVRTRDARISDLEAEVAHHQELLKVRCAITCIYVSVDKYLTPLTVYDMHYVTENNIHDLMMSWSVDQRSNRGLGCQDVQTIAFGKNLQLNLVKTNLSTAMCAGSLYDMRNIVFALSWSLYYRCSYYRGIWYVSYVRQAL